MRYVRIMFGVYEKSMRALNDGCTRQKGYYISRFLYGTQYTIIARSLFTHDPKIRRIR